MEYVIPVVVLVLVVAGFVTFMVLNATRQSAPQKERRPGRERLEPEPPASERLGNRE